MALKERNIFDKIICLFFSRKQMVDADRSFGFRFVFGFVFGGLVDF